MQPLKSNEIFGSWCTLLLPINPDNSINFSKLELEIDALISMKVNGIYSNGTAGEFDLQTEEEFDRIQAILAKKCEVAGVPFQIGCSHTSPIISLERVKRSAPLKPGAIQVILPDWYPPNMYEIIQYLKRMAEAASPVGLVIYNPPHAKKILLPEDYMQIINAGIPLLGCKVAGGDEVWYAKMKRLVPGLSLFVAGHTLATGFKLGAHGSYSNVACLNPQIAQQWYERMKYDIENALKLEKRIQAFIHHEILPFITKRKISSQAVDKFLSALGGWTDIGTRVRWPYQGINESEIIPVQKRCRKTLPEFFS